MIRIGRLDLERWGHFDGRSLPFGPAGRLHVVYGDNEAGKSTTRRALSALLFGIDPRTPDKRAWAYGDLRVGALLDLDGTTVELVRRKGRKDTLLDPDGQVVDPAPLDRALNGLSKEVHAGLFEITHDSLVAGGVALLEDGGEVGESLFAAAAGTTRLNGLLRALEAEADDIYKPRGRTLKLNVALAAHAEATKALRGAGLRSAEHERLATELEGLERAVVVAGEELTQADGEIARLRRLHSVMRSVVRHGERVRALSELGAVAALAPGAVERREAAMARREAAAAQLRAADLAIERCTPKLAAIAVDEPLLARAEEILELHTRAAAVREAAERRAEVGTELAAEEAALAALLRALAPALGSRSLDAVSLDDAARERLDRCLEARAGVEQGATTAREGLKLARRAAEADAEAVAADAGAVDDAALLAALRAARDGLGSERTADEARGEQAAALARAEAAAQRMRPGVEGSAGGDGATAPRATAVAALAVPDDAAVDALLAQDAALREALAAAEHDDARLAEERAEAEEQRAALTGATPLPAAEALPAARAVRSERWAEVRAALVDSPTDPKPIADAFESAVAGADAIADQHLQRAGDVAAVAAIDARLAALDRRAHAAAEGRERRAAERFALEDAWAADWSAVDASAPSPAQAPAWRDARVSVLAHLATADDKGRAADVAEGEAARHRAALAAALTATGATIAEAATLAGLFEQAEAHAAALRERRERRERLIATAERSAAALVAAEEQEREASGAQGAWVTTWEGLRDECGLDAALSPDDALGALRRLSEAATLQAHVLRLTRERDGLDARSGQLTGDVAELCAAVVPDLADATPAMAVATLQQRVTAARKAERDRAGLEETLSGDEEQRDLARAKVQEAEAGLAALRAAAGVEDDAALLAAEERAARATTLRAEIAELELDIAETGGAALDVVIAAVAELDADTLPATIEALAASRGELLDRRDAAREARGLARAELARLEQSDAGAEAAQAAAGQLATVRTLAERYVRAALAQRVLREAMERYRREHEGPMLARANVLFPTLTCGEHTALETDLGDHDEWVLVAIGADGARRRVAELSDGAREQLYLALRLAAIERYVEGSGPMPVVFDDVLLESDDARAAQILSVLGELAHRTQVIVLTHHRHLVRIARSVLPAGQLDLIELEEHAAAPEPDPEPERTPEPVTLADELEAVLPGGGPPLAGEQTSLL